MLERNPGGRKAGITCNLGLISGPIINYLCDTGGHCSSLVLSLICTKKSLGKVTPVFLSRIII